MRNGFLDEPISPLSSEPHLCPACLPLEQLIRQLPPRASSVVIPIYGSPRSRRITAGGPLLLLLVLGIWRRSKARYTHARHVQ